MKLTELKTNETTVLHVRNPETGERMIEGDTPVTITLRGMHTDAFQAEFNKQIQRAKQNEKRGVIKTPAQERADSAALYASATVSWTGIDGEFSNETARAMYEPEHMAWLRNQIGEALREHSESIKK